MAPMAFTHGVLPQFLTGWLPGAGGGGGDVGQGVGGRGRRNPALLLRFLNPQPVSPLQGYLAVGSYGVALGGWVFLMLDRELMGDGGPRVGGRGRRDPALGNSNSHGARPVHLIITMIKWIRNSRLSIKNSFSPPPRGREVGREGGRERAREGKGEKGRESARARERERGVRQTKTPLEQPTCCGALLVVTHPLLPLVNI